MLDLPVREIKRVIVRDDQESRDLRQNWPHVIAAAANVSGEMELIVIGRQAILASAPDAPEEMLRSLEVDLYPRHRPEGADEIEGVLGDGSRFHADKGYYALMAFARNRVPGGPPGADTGEIAARFAPTWRRLSTAPDADAPPRGPMAKVPRYWHRLRRV